MARRVADLQEQQFQFQMVMQRQQAEFQAKVQQDELNIRKTNQGREFDLRYVTQHDEMELRRQMQRDETELRRFALEVAAANDRANIQRLDQADINRNEFAHRGQTFAMWLAGTSTAALLGGGLAVIFFTVAGTIAPAAGATLAGLLLAAGLITGISNLVKNFLPGRSYPQITSDAKSSIEARDDTDTDTDVTAELNDGNGNELNPGDVDRTLPPGGYRLPPSDTLL